MSEPLKEIALSQTVTAKECWLLKLCLGHMRACGDQQSASISKPLLCKIDWMLQLTAVKFWHPSWSMQGSIAYGFSTPACLTLFFYYTRLFAPLLSRLICLLGPAYTISACIICKLTSISCDCRIPALISPTSLSMRVMSTQGLATRPIPMSQSLIPHQPW